MNFEIFEIQYTKNYKIQKAKIQKLQYFENSALKNLYVLGIKNSRFFKIFEQLKNFQLKNSNIFFLEFSLF